jgi:hypothetical protein
VSTNHRKGCSDKRCAHDWSTPPGEAKCFCHGCERWVGLCMVGYKDMEELCCDCWYHVTIWRENVRRELWGTR